MGNPQAPQQAPQQAPMLNLPNMYEHPVTTPVQYNFQPQYAGGTPYPQAPPAMPQSSYNHSSSRPKYATSSILNPVAQPQPALYTAPQQAQQHQAQPTQAFTPMRTFIVEYYGDLDMIKVKQVNNTGIYMAKVPCGLINSHRYVIASLPNDDRSPLNTLRKLSAIPWVILQTRTLPENIPLPVQYYESRRYPPLMGAIQLSQRSETEWTYVCDSMPVTVKLYPKGKAGFDYADKGTIVSALESFNTSLHI